MENFLVLTLKKIINKYKFNEKILIAPSFNTGNQILQQLCKDSNGWINFKATTVQSLASEIAQPTLIKYEIEEISSLEINIIIDGVFTELTEKGDLNYFKKYKINTGIISAISKNIIELKMSLKFPEDLKNHYFIDPRKAEDIRLIFSEYQKILKNKKLADTADIIETAYRLISKRAENEDKKYILISGDKKPPLEEKFLNKLSNESLIVLPGEKVYGLIPPKNRWESKEYKPLGKSKMPAWLFDIKNIYPEVKENKLELFCAANHRNEIGEVLNSIACSNIPLDKTEIIYSNRKPYLLILFSMCRKLDLPVTFSEGLPGDISSAGMALKGFLLWMGDRFFEIHLRKLLKYSLIKVPNKKGPVLAHTLRTSKIGWGRKRYNLVLKKKLKFLENTENKKYKNRIENIKLLKDISQNLLNIIPEIDDGEINFSSLCTSCISFLDNFILSKDEDNASYISVLKKRLEILSKITDKILPLDEAITKLLEIIKKIPFQKSASKPSCLHISSISEGGKSGRDNIFILGFDSHNFPGTNIQDPIILDEERKKIGSSLELSGDKLKEKLYDFAAMLSSLGGSISVSYSSYNIKEGRYLFPSSVFLQIYRLKEKDPSIDYGKLFKNLKMPSGFSVTKDIEEAGWWIEKLTGSGTLKDARKSIFNIYPWLEQGDIALRERNKNILTIYDGYIQPEEGELDPRKNKDMVLSCSGLETYAECPYRFFLEYILKVRRPEEVERNSLQWLDPAQRGSLLHEVFQSFVKKLKDLKSVPDIESQKKIINRILEKIIKKYIEIIPIPGEASYRSEVEALRRDLEIFIEINSNLESPHLLEYSFGYGKDKPVEICIGKETYIRIKGKVDRVDIDRNGYLYVWDYKTGSAYSFEKDGYISKGRQLQHILYAIVVEKNIGKNCKVCGYILPTEKGISSGKGYLFMRDPRATERWQEGLSCILDLISNGIFIISDEENPPYIDDTDIYGTKEEKKLIKEKIKNSENSLLKKWNDLKDFT